MPFVQSKANASGAGNFTTWSITFTNPVAAGSQMYLVLKSSQTGVVGLNISDTLGTNWHSGLFVGPGIAAWSSETTPGGANTVTVTVSGGGHLQSICACILEYSDPSNPLVNTYPPGFVGWGLLNPSFATIIPTGGGLGPAPLTCANQVWQPSTSYNHNPAEYITVVDTGPAPAHLQDAQNAGTSDTVPPVWNQSGGTTTEATGLIWDDRAAGIAGAAPDFMVPLLIIGSLPFVEFPAPGAGWVLRAQISGLSGLSVYDRAIVPFTSSVTASVSKTIDTYTLTVMLFAASTSQAPAALAGSVFGTFTGIIKPGKFGGGAT